MRITGRDFMDWYDAWSADPSTKGLVWENDGSVSELHDAQGAWILDPDRVFDLSELGEIDHDLSNGPRRAPPDTEATVASWLENRELHRELVVVPVRHVSFLRHTLARELGEDLAVVRDVSSVSARQASGADLVHFVRTAFPEDCLIEEGGIVDENDEPIVDIEAYYDIDDLIEISGPVSIAAAFERYLTTRFACPSIVVVPERLAGPLRAFVERMDAELAADAARPRTPSP